MEASVPNIGPAQRHRRLVFGAGALIIAAGAALALAAVHADLIIRAVVALPLYGAALGFFQYRERT